MKLKQILAAAVLLAGICFYACVEDTYNLNIDPANRNLRPVKIEGKLATVNIELMKWLGHLLSDGDSAKMANLIKVFKKGEYSSDYEGVVYMEFNDSNELDWTDLKTMINLEDIELSYTLNENLLRRALAEYDIPSQHQVLIGDNKVGSKYNSISFSSAYFEMTNVNIPSGVTGALMVTIPEITLNGQPYSFEIEFAKGAVSGNMQQNISTGRLEFDNNGVNIGGKIRIDSIDNSFVPGNNISFKITLHDFDVESADGYFGQFAIDEKDSEFEFSIFNDLQIFDGQFSFGDIILETSVENEIGVPFEVKAEDIRLYNNDEATGNLTVNGNNYLQMNVTSAGTDGSRGGGYADVNGNNSNIAELTSSFPNKIIYNLTGLSNQEGNPAAWNFISRNTMLNVDLSLKFPFHFKASTYNRTDTIAFNADSLYGEFVTQASDLEYFNLYFDISNRLPFDGDLAVYVIDGNGKKIDDLELGKNSDILLGGTDSQPGKTNFTVNLTGEQAVSYVEKKATQIVLATTASTTNDGTEFVKVYEHTGFTIVISMDAKLRIPTKF